MATLSGKQQVIFDANTLHRTLQDFQELIAIMSPNDQLLNGNHLLPMGTQLKALQQRVQATYLDRAGAIEEISPSELEEITSKLAMGAEILQSIEHGTAIAATLCELQNEVDTLYDPKPEEISALHARLRELLNSHQFLNSGARAAIVSLDHSLKSVASQAAPPSVQPRSMPPQPSKDLPRSPPPLPSSPETLPQAPRQIARQAERTADVAERTLRPQPSAAETSPLRSPDLRQPRPEKSRAAKLSREREANEDKVVAHYVRLAQLVELEGKLPLNQLFNEAIKFYEEIFSSRASDFSDDDHLLLDGAMSLLKRIIEKQKELESRLPENQTFLILDIIENAVKKAIEAQKANEKASVEEFLSTISKAYESLNMHTKRMLAQANESVLQKAGKAAITWTLFVSFGAWPGSWEQKLEALKIVKQQLQTHSQHPPLSSPALTELQTELKRLLAASGSSAPMMRPYEQLVDQSWAKLNDEEKAEVAESLNTLLKGQFRDTLKRFPFSQWSGSWRQKLEAVERLLNPDHFYLPAPPKISDEMQQRIYQLPQASIPLDDSFVVIYSPPSDGSALEYRQEVFLHKEPADQTQRSHPYGRIYSEIISQYPGIEALPKLVEIGSRLTSLDSPKDALGILKELEEKKLSSSFKISDQSLRPIHGRLYHHLYFIHKNESPKLLKEDPEYGRKAFMGEFPATNSERIRAITRTSVELMLETLEDMINFEQTGSEAMECILALMDSTVDEIDKVDGITNLSHLLYAKFEQLHASARSQDPTLANPAESKYKGDFGRIAFKQTAPGIDPSLKVKAIEQVRQAMKTAWKLQ